MSHLLLLLMSCSNTILTNIWSRGQAFWALSVAGNLDLVINDEKPMQLRPLILGYHVNAETHIGTCRSWSDLLWKIHGQVDGKAYTDSVSDSVSKSHGYNSPWWRHNNDSFERRVRGSNIKGLFTKHLNSSTKLQAQNTSFLKST